MDERCIILIDCTTQSTRSYTSPQPTRNGATRVQNVLEQHPSVPSRSLSAVRGEDFEHTHVKRIYVTLLV